MRSCACVMAIACACAYTGLLTSGHARGVDRGDTLSIERLGGGSMLVARHGGTRLTISRAGPSAARQLLGRWRDGEGPPPPREVVVVPDLSQAAGAVPRAVAGADGSLGTGDDVALTESLLPSAPLDPDDPVHTSIERALRSSARLSPGVDTCVGGQARPPSESCIAVRSWHRPAAPATSGLSLCVEAAGQVVWIPGELSATDDLSSCPEATVLWIHETAMDRALAGGRGWIDALDEDLTVVMTPDDSGGCGPRYSSLGALAPRTVVSLAPTGVHNTGACAGRVDTAAYTPISAVDQVRWTRP